MLRPLLDHLDEIPPQQADALRSALGLSAAGTYDRFTICAATLSLLAAAAESKPLLVLVDDAQWLDRATSDALLFAAKRLVADSAAILLAVREGGERSFEAPALEYLELRPLRCEEAERLLSRRGHRAGSRP